MAAMVLAMLFMAAPAGAQATFETVAVLPADGSAGRHPQGPLARAGDGWVYGLTDVLGTEATVFRFDPANPGATFETVWRASEQSYVVGTVGDGGLVAAADGHAYFVASGKHPSSPCPPGSGWIGRVAPGGAVTAAFAAFCPGDGAPINPYPGLAVGPDGALYGTAMIYTGGGAVYRLGLDGAFRKVADVVAMLGMPNALAAAGDGWLYGTTQGTFGGGQLYRVHPGTGAAQVLHTFSTGRPWGRLLDVAPGAGEDTALVGVTAEGGLYNAGEVHRVAVTGGVATLTTVHAFTGGHGGLPDDGNRPRAGLVADAGGRLYGTTHGGPTGRVYRIDPGGAFAQVHDLGLTPSGGVVSLAPLLIAPNGDLYGTTYDYSGGPPPTSDAAGSVFRLRLALGGADLRVTGASDPVAQAAPGSTFVVTETTANQGGAAAGASTTRFYLSLDATKGAGDFRLTGSRAVPSLAAGGTSSGSVTVTIPATVVPGVYRQLACADDRAEVAEGNEVNNCLASSTTIRVARPDFVQVVVSEPPATVAPATKFTITDTVQNPNAVDAPASRTRYYLSADAVRDAADVLLTGSRSVPTIDAGGSSTGTVSVTVPTGAPLGSYRLIACADDQKKVPETNEGNNCAASAGLTRVARPDLVTGTVTGVPAAIAPGLKFTITDTAANHGAGPAVASKSRYYLSADAARDPGDVLLTGTRSVVALAPGAVSTGSKVVTVPLSMPPGTYHALACADDLEAVGETNETNNCTAAAGTVVVGP